MSDTISLEEIEELRNRAERERPSGFSSVSLYQSEFDKLCTLAKQALVLRRLAQTIVDRAHQETLSTHVEVSFEPGDAALILTIAEQILASPP